MVHRATPLMTLAALSLLTVPATTLAGTVIEPQPPMGAPLNGLTRPQMQAFLDGQVVYNTPLEVEQGLGPVFNKESCGNCHANPLGGTGSQTVTRFGLTGKGGFEDLAHLGGSLLQSQSISEECAEVIPAEASITANRVTNGIMGYGLIEAIPDAQIEAVQAAQPVGQQGMVRYVTAVEDPPMSPDRVGRFGWKAQVATVFTFSADAGLNELGLTSVFFPNESDPNGINPPALGDPDFCDMVPDPENSIALGNGVDKDFLEVVTDFQRLLAAPPQTPRSGMTGETIFNNIGCAVCHHASYTTADDPMLEDVLRDKTVKPYTDFLVHDMGLTADFIADGPVGERWMKTAPLSGLRVRDPLWHDGRFVAGSFVERVTLAIEAHDALLSQGISAAQAFAALDETQKGQLFAFLGSLGRREFDADGDGDVQIDDFRAVDGPATFESCLGGGPYTADDACAVHDVDQDGDVDADDFASMALVLEDPQGDCNGNMIGDLQEIVEGLVLDANGNGIPDTCDGCAADFNGSGSVDVSDLVELILAWGPCEGCPQDLNGDGLVEVQDLVQLILSWDFPCAG